MATIDNRCDLIFWTAQEITSPDRRAAYLDQVCGNDAALRAQIDEMLAAYPKVNHFLEVPALAAAAVGQAFQPATSHPAEAPGTRIGPYKLLQQIGEGGFGVVYMAEQQTPVRRKVALKIIKPGMDTKEVIARFESERQALALMDHPNIAKVLDAGSTEEARSAELGARSDDDSQASAASTPRSPLRALRLVAGRPYFVMELVKGVPITDYCDSNHLPPDERLELFIQVCNALQHAHQKGIIHRDLKPSNVMVTMHDGRPVPKVIDFGVAKATSQTLTERTLFTAYGQMIGTPAYMSPEQAEMSCLDIDTRSDIYSLGVLLYELLTGTTPFEAKRLREAGFAEMARIIKEEEPESVSTRIAKITKAQSAELGARSKSASAPHSALRAPRFLAWLKTESRKLKTSSELDWIVARSLEKDRERRYESASAFARDVRRYLADEPVQACPPSTIYRIRKSARKHKTVLIATSVVIVSLLAGTTLSLWQAIRATAAEAQANANEAKSKKSAVAESVQRQRSEANFALALDAVDRMISSVNDPTLNEIPQIGLLQRKLLKDALAFYERIPLDSEVSSDVRFRLASTWDRIAKASWTLNEPEQAASTYKRAIETFSQLVIQNPDQRTYRWKFADCLSSMGSFYLDLGSNYEEGESAYRWALEQYSELARLHPDQTLWLNRQAGAFEGIAKSFRRRGRNEESIAAATRALEFLGPTVQDSAYLRGKILCDIGFAHSDPIQREDFLRRAIAEFRAFFAAGFKNDGYKDQFAGRLKSIAGDFANRHPAEAEKLFAESAALYREIAVAAPRSGNAAYWHVVALQYQAQHLRNVVAKGSLRNGDGDNENRLTTAQSLFQEAIALQRQNVSRFDLARDRLLLARLLEQESNYLLNELGDVTEKRSSITTPTKLQADALLTEAIQLCRALTAEFPDNADYKSRLADLEKLQSQHFGQPSTAEQAK